MRRVRECLVAMAGILVLLSLAVVIPVAGRFLPQEMPDACLQILHAGPFLYLSALLVSLLKTPYRKIRSPLYPALALALAPLILELGAIGLFCCLLGSLVFYVLYLRALAVQMGRSDLQIRSQWVLALALPTLLYLWQPWLWFAGLIFWVLLISLIVRISLAVDPYLAGQARFELPGELEDANRDRL